MNQTEQTAVQWLIMRIRERQALTEPGSKPNFNALFDKAIEMEREQIVKALYIGIRHGYNCLTDTYQTEE